jgi:hypothetical protein
MKTSHLTRSFLLDLIEQLEQAQCHPILLRNYEGFPDEIGNDLDVYVHPSKLKCSFDILKSCAEKQGGSIKHLHRRGYFVAIWLCFPDEVRPVHVDLYHGALTWHGANYLEDAELINSAETSASEIPYKIPAPAHEAMVSCLASILWGGFFKARYQEHVSQLLDSKAQETIFIDHLVRCFGDHGKKLATDVREKRISGLMDQGYARKLRSSLLRKQFGSHPMRFAKALCQHWVEEAFCYFYRLPGVILEFDASQWSVGEMSKLREELGPYFGETHLWQARSWTIMNQLKAHRLRGKNHLVLVPGNQFRVNGANVATHIAGESLKSQHLVHAVLTLLSQRLAMQFKIS